jgi:hypothetical protein
VEGFFRSKKRLKVGETIANFNVNGKDLNLEDVFAYLSNDKDVELHLDVVNKSGKKREVVLKKAKLLPKLTNK